MAKLLIEMESDLVAYLLEYQSEDWMPMSILLELESALLAAQPAGDKWEPVSPLVPIHKANGEIAGVTPFHLHADDENGNEAFVITLLEDAAHLHVLDVTNDNQGIARFGTTLRLCRNINT